MWSLVKARLRELLLEAMSILYIFALYIYISFFLFFFNYYYFYFFPYGQHLISLLMSTLDVNKTKKKTHINESLFIYRGVYLFCISSKVNIIGNN